ncbi:hypothetical protein chiPu_0031997, partial [Chiloscyllium punctatum]|nr:hypothetical protein [Chiloscyllium punctatum]
AGEAEPETRFEAALLERVQIGQHQQRQRHQLREVGIVFEALEVEDRVEREHHHHEERAAPIHDAQRDQPAHHEREADGRHRKRIGRPVGDREDPEPDPGDPARQRRMLAIAEQETLPPGIGLRDVHMDVLRGLQLDQDKRPEKRVDQCEADHEPQAGSGIDGP